MGLGWRALEPLQSAAHGWSWLHARPLLWRTRTLRCRETVIAGSHSTSVMKTLGADTSKTLMSWPVS